MKIQPDLRTGFDLHRSGAETRNVPYDHLASLDDILTGV